MTKLKEQLSSRRETVAFFATMLLSLVSGLQLSKAQSQTTVQSGGARVPAALMATHCVTVISPNYPRITPLPNPTTVSVEVTVTRSGTVRPIRIMSGPQPFASAALDAVRLWHYRPYTQNDTPIDVITEVSVRFIPGSPGGMVSHPTE